MDGPPTGVRPAAPAPSTDDGAIDPRGRKRAPGGMIGRGVDAIGIPARCSELLVQFDDERAPRTRVSLEHVARRVPVRVTVGHFPTRVVMAGAMAAAMPMMLPPCHGVGLVPSEAGGIAHFAAR